MKIWFAKGDFETSSIIIKGVPLESTTQFLKGTWFAPQRIREAAETLESYSFIFQKSLKKEEICDDGDMNFPENWDMDFSLKEIEKYASWVVEKEKKPIFLGGEHTLTLGVIKGIVKKFRNLMVISIDAHADLKKRSEKNEFLSHATVMRRIMEEIGEKNIYLWGVRTLSGASEEKIFKKIRKNRLKKKVPVYLSIDVDVIDPGLLSGVTAPEPGGISYRELMNFFKKLKEYKIVGGDICEFNPLVSSLSEASQVAGILRELIALIQEP